MSVWNEINLPKWFHMQAWEKKKKKKGEAQLRPSSKKIILAWLGLFLRNRHQASRVSAPFCSLNQSCTMRLLVFTHNNIISWLFGPQEPAGRRAITHLFSWRYKYSRLEKLFPVRRAALLRGQVWAASWSLRCSRNLTWNWSRKEKEWFSSILAEANLVTISD